MAKRIIKPSVVASTASLKRAEDILKLIRERQYGEKHKYIGPDGKLCVPKNLSQIFKKHPTEPERASPSADDFQKFKRDFIEEYNGEQVKPTGMTHSEFFDYFKNGTRECEKPMGTLQRLLKEMEEE